MWLGSSLQFPLSTQSTLATFPPGKDAPPCVTVKLKVKGSLDTPQEAGQGEGMLPAPLPWRQRHTMPGFRASALSTLLTFLGFRDSLTFFLPLFVMSRLLTTHLTSIPGEKSSGKLTRSCRIQMRKTWYVPFPCTENSLPGPGSAVSHPQIPKSPKGRWRE